MKVQAITAGVPAATYNDSLSNQNDFNDANFPIPGIPDNHIEDINFDKNNMQQVEKAVQQLNNTMEVYHTELRFSLHEESGEYFVKVINPVDNTVIREIPPEKTLNMVAYFKELLGLMVDKFI